MRAASTALQNILSSGVALRADLYTITLAGGAATFRFTTHELPLVVGGQTFGTQLLFTRGKVTQSVGLQVQTTELQIAPQLDHPDGAFAINGVPFLHAVNDGALDGAHILMQKLFLASRDDTSPGALWWFQGRGSTARAGGMVAYVPVASDIEILNIAMPRHVYQAGCVHTLYGPNCGLNKASFEVSGSTAGTPTVLTIPTNLGQADGYFDLGILRITSGPLTGVQRVVRSHAAAGGTLRLVSPLPSAPASGVGIAVTPGCDKRQTTCASKFSNLAKFRGYPYIPVPETLYDGGAAAAQAPAAGGQGSIIGGSEYTGLIDPLTYVP
jgi:uncharacterized phage protein (TIGR02218 family)